MYLFSDDINNWCDWSKMIRLASVFAPLIERIIRIENLPSTEIEHIEPGYVSAVFKVGTCIVKIFAPPAICNDFGECFDVELFGMKWANAQNVPAAKLLAYGKVEDKYDFRYMIMEFINGKRLDHIEESLSYNDKVVIGQNMRKITDKLNNPCSNFTPFDVKQYALDTNEWVNDGFPNSFLTERLAYITDMQIADKVFCHGDMHCHNILIDNNLNVFLIDFANAMHAPAEYEQAYIASCLWCFEKPYMVGYFGDYCVEDIVELCMTWLPIHAEGNDTIIGNLGSADKITTFAVLREKLYDIIETEKQKN